MDARRYLKSSRRDRLVAGDPAAAPGQSLRNSEKVVEVNLEPTRAQVRQEEQQRAAREEARKEALTRWWHRVLTTCKWLAAGVVLGGLLWLMPVLWGWLDRPIARVEVSGNFRYLDQKQIEAGLRPYLSKTFFSVNLHDIQGHLMRDSWVSSVKVRRTWPDMVSVVIDEDVPVARWRDHELLNAEGEVIRSRQGRGFQEMPALAGPAGSEELVMLEYMTLSQQLRPLELKVGGVTLNAAGSWSFRVDGILVQLGRDELIERMHRFSRLYHLRLKDDWDSIKSIDLRYRDGIAVAWAKP